MKVYFFPLFLIVFLLLGCEEEKKISSIDPVNWQKRSISLPASDSLTRGSSYLSVYSEIYSVTEERTHNLTVTVSIRNVSSTDSVFILRSDYYDTHGELIRTYFDHPVFVAPLETIEIVIDEGDEVGGTGGNFIFEWATKPDIHEPFFEAVMISTSGQQGISFTTRGIRR
ncbi:DUF3124 domain-containing protein [Flavilitoribacter nigricans]|uniref:DUF3124 domain-containing protein n=1 Tax=Flavilitoribacter nigricans (strain ATCC 23147 / DSM 23189 / NBRC 102662 / NCIMB 1420 / SS-2) TaxID=1122177 RepID=A0A2D0NDI7_FLAN2|nr:DUF3124 domain-containing protein [Flavilitoribacter nigricans]PHN06537.1 hypothetical protein CRP01_09540 [Flavilitoribacter nigricans DSM 23189 = NBRC 102662]